MTTPPPDGADPIAALATLATIAADVDPELLLVAMARDGTPEVTSAEATTALASALRGVVRTHVDDWTDRETLAYGPAVEIADGQIMWVPLAEVPMLHIDAVDAEVADLPMFDPAPSYLRRLRLSAIRAATATGQAIFFRSVSPTQVIGRSNKIPVIRSGNRLDVVSDRTLFIDRGVDAVVVEDVVLFADRQRFQRVFGFLEQLREQAGATFDTVITGLNISNLHELRAAATGQIQMLGKLASIARKLEQYPTYKQALTMPKLLEFVRANPHTNVKIEGEGAAAQFVFEPDPQHRFKILKLLDDDYLRSQLTSLAYEANSKGLPLT